jgi:hypothetical protein
MNLKNFLLVPLPVLMYADGFHKKRRIYRIGRFLWWMLAAIFVASFFLMRLELTLAIGLALLVTSVAVSCIACPYCGKPVGLAKVADYLQPLVWPFGGWCVNCRARLFLRSRGPMD